MDTRGIVAACILGMAVAALATDKPEAGPEARKPRPPGAPGQRMMDPEQMSMMMFKEIGLSKDQQDQMKAIMEGSAKSTRELREKMEATAKAQGDLLAQETPDEAAVLKAADEIAALRAEMGRIRIKQLLAAQKILTPEQRATLREKIKERMEQQVQMHLERRKGAEGRREGGAPPPAPRAE